MNTYYNTIGLTTKQKYEVPVYTVLTTKNRYTAPYNIEIIATNQIAKSNLLLDLHVLNSYGMSSSYNKTYVTTECTYSPLFDGTIYGSIFQNSIDTLYNGVVEVYHSNSLYKISEYTTTNGTFNITGLNPIQNYDIKCIPSDPTVYTSKYINNYKPIVKNIPVSINILSESNDLYYDYEMIISVNNVYGNISVNVLNSDFLSVTNLYENIYKIHGKPTSNTFIFTLNVSDVRGNITSNYSHEFEPNLNSKLIDINFKDKITASFNTETIINSPVFIDNALEISGNNPLTIVSPVLNVDTRNFEFIIDFKIISKINNEIMCLFSSQSGNTLLADSTVFLELNRHGLKFKLNNTNLDNNQVTNLVNYVFEYSMLYSLKVSRFNGVLYIYINNELVFTNTDFNLPINFVNNGSLCIGNAPWYATNVGAKIQISDFRFCVDNKFPKLLNVYEQSVRKSTSSIFFDYVNNSIYDTALTTYDISQFTKTASGYYKSGNNPVYSNIEIGLNDFTIELKGNFAGTAIQYILYSDILKLYYDNGNMKLNINNKQFSIAMSGINTIQFNKNKNIVSIAVNGTKLSNTILTEYENSVYIKNIVVMSDDKGLMKCTSSIEYITIDGISYKNNMIGRSLYIDNMSIAVVYNETFNYVLKKPSNATGSVVWSIIDGTLPDGITLTGNVLSGVTLNKTTKKVTFKCVDSFNKVGTFTAVINIGTIVLLHHFDSNLTDATGKVWSGTNTYNTSIYKFGTASAAFNGTSNSISTPNTTDHDFNNNDFTISAWVYNTGAHSSTYRGIISKRTTWSATTCAWTLMRYNSTTNKYSFEGWNSAISFGISFGDVITLNRWDFVTVSRKNGYLYCGVNGKIERFYFGYNIQSINLPTIIGKLTSSADYFSGYIDEIKIVQNAALYVDDFDVPTVPSDFPAIV